MRHTDEEARGVAAEALESNAPQSMRVTSRLATGTKLAGGRLLLNRRLGAGGMGSVYEALDSDRGGMVALKTLDQVCPAAVYQFKNEFRALADLAHRNLVRLYELFSEDELWFYTMELVEGVPFDLWVRPNGVLAEARLRHGLQQLVDALGAVHGAGKLHRDLKPSNVLVARDGRVVVLDFGLAIDAIRGGIGQTLTENLFVGTPAYMAPEQSMGQPLGCSSDLYALGVMLFEALTGRRPFEGGLHQLIVSKQHQEAPVPSALARDVPPDLETLCVGLLERNPERRPSLSELARKLDRGELVHGVALPVAADSPMLFGRDSELGVLRDAYAESKRGQRPVLVLISGEGGIGKTALAAALLAELRREGHALVLSGRCYERESVPFKAFDAVVDELSRWLRCLPAERVSALLPRDTFAIRRLFPVLGRIGAFAETPERDVADAHELRHRAFLAFGELLGRIRDRQPLVIHLDDLQWSDADSTTLLMHLLRQSDAPRILLIASHRDESAGNHPYLAPLYKELLLDVRLDVRQLALGPLTDDSARAILGGTGIEAPAALLAEAAGNPFLLQELARHAAAGSSATVQALSLRALLLARLHSLPPESQKMLRLLAVAAQPVPLGAVVRAAEVDTQSQTCFDSLRSAWLARATGHGGLAECFHDRVREIVLETLSADQLADHHRCLAAALATTPGIDPARLATHHLSAGEPRLAAEQWVHAAERANRELGFDRAARLYGLALEHGQFSSEQRQQLRAARADALGEAGSGVAAAEAYLEAAANATAETTGELTVRAAEQYLYAGHLERGLALLSSALEQLGIRIPRSTAEVVASIFYHEARLRLRQYRWSGERELAATDASRIDVLRRAADVLLRIDVLRGIEFGLRCALAELSQGSRDDASIALWRLACATTMRGGSASAVARAIARAELFSRDSHAPLVQAYRDVFLACTFSIGPAMDFDRHVWHLEQTLERLHGQDRLFAQTSYNRGLCSWMLTAARVTGGEFSKPAAELPAHLDDAWNRGDLCLVPLWQRVLTLSGLALGRAAYVRRTLERASAAWSSSQMTFQEFNLLDASCMLATYCGDTQLAWEFSERMERRMSASPMRYTVFMDVTRARRVQLGCALLTQRGSKSSEDLRALSRSASSIRNAFHRQIAEAAIACGKGDPPRAIRALRAALRFPAWRIENHAIKRKLGTLLGGDEGRALRVEADAFFEAGGGVDAERYSDTLAPGLTL